MMFMIMRTLQYAIHGMKLTAGCLMTTSSVTIVETLQGC